MPSPKTRVTQAARFPHAIKAGRHLSEADPRLARVISKVGRIRIELDPKETIFESLATSIIYQQLHGKAAAAIVNRFREACAPGKDCFPHPELILAATDETLRFAGLSKTKAAAIRALAEHVSAGKIPDRAQAAAMDDEALIEAFTQVKGIGRWTSQMLLIFTLGRPDVLPTADYGVKKGFSIVYGKKKLPSPKELERHGEIWRPYRSAAAWYFWRALELPEFKNIKVDS